MASGLPHVLASGRRVAVRSESGFTLLELVLVMLVIGIVMAMAFPHFTNIGGGNLKGEARTLVGHIQGLYSEATFTRRMYRLAFDLDQERYWAEVRDGDDFGPVARSFLKPVDLPVNITLTDVTVPGQGRRSDGTAYAYFDPLGRADRAIIHLMGPDEETLTLRINPVTGRVRVDAGYIEENFTMGAGG